MRKYRFILIPILFFPIWHLWDYALTHNYLTACYYLDQSFIESNEMISNKLNSISDYKMDYSIYNDWSYYKVELFQEQKTKFSTKLDSSRNATIIFFKGYSLSEDDHIHVYDCYPWDFWKTYVRQYLFEKNILDKIGLEYKKDWGYMLIEHWGQLLFNSQWIIYLIIIFFPSISKLYGKIKKTVTRKGC